MNATAFPRQLALGAALGALVLVAGACSSTTGAARTTFPPADAAVASALPAPAASVVTATPLPSVAPSLGAIAIDFIPGTVASPRVIEMTADDNLNFTPGSVVVAKDETVTFKIKNVGKAEHEFMIGPIDAAFADAEGTPEVAGIKKGATGTLTVTFDKPGQYAFACHEPGHFEHGMLGFVTVVGPEAPAMGTANEPRSITVNMTDKLAFTPNTIQVRKGETIRFIVTNSGTATHEFMLGPADKVAADEGDGKITVEADELDQGSTHQLVYTFDGSGPYAFACHEPGHFEAGMAGTIELVD